MLLHSLGFGYLPLHCSSTIFQLQHSDHRPITHWARDKMAGSFLTTFSNAFSWMKMYKFRLNFKFIPKGPINVIPALVQIMACRRPGDKPLSEPMMVILLTHICVTRPPWVLIYLRSLTVFSSSLTRLVHPDFYSFFLLWSHWHSQLARSFLSNLICITHGHVAVPVETLKFRKPTRQLRANHKHKYQTFPAETTGLKSFIVHRIIPEWNILPACVAEAESVARFKSQLVQLESTSA